MSLETLVIWIVVGAAAGWLIGVFIKGYGFGLLGNMLVGVLGGVIGGVLLSLLQFSGLGTHGGYLGIIVAGALGAGAALSPLAFRKNERAASSTPSKVRGPVPEAPPTRQHQSADVFLSYKREERARVEDIASALRNLKLNVWFDARLTSGHHFDEEINREVRAAKAVLVCWSKAAVGSEWVRAEASIGRQRGVLAACFLEECEPFTPFNLIHAEDLRDGALDATNPAWVKIVEQLGQLAGRDGLRSYLELPASDRSACAAWLAKHATDPLADAVLARMRLA